MRRRAVSFACVAVLAVAGTVLTGVVRPQDLSGAVD